MYKKYNTAHNRALSFEDFCKKNKIKLEAKPIVNELTPIVPKLRIKLENIHKKRTQNTRVISKLKHSDKKTLAHFLSHTNQLFFNYFIKIKKPEKTDTFTHTASFYIHANDGLLFNEASQRITLCEEMGDSLIEVGITPENLTELKNETAEYQKIILKPRELQKANKILTKQENNLIRALNDIFNLRMNKVMSSNFEESDPQLYAAYKLAAKKDKPGRRKLAMRGFIKNKATGEIVKGAHILIPKLEIDHRCRGKKGGYHINNIETGIFPVRVEAKNFKTQETTLVHNEGETVEMNFILEPELI